MSCNNVHLSNYYSKTKDIYIPLYDYHKFHGASKIDRPDNRIIKREQLHNRIRSCFQNQFSDDRKQRQLFNGVYLVSGFRGMGKTTLVKDAINSLFNRENKNDRMLKRSLYKVVELDLSKSNIDEESILRSLVWSLNDKYQQSSVIKLGIILRVSIVVAGILIGFFQYDLISKIINLEKYNHWFITSAICALVGLILIKISDYLLNQLDIITHRRIFKRLNFLNARINSKISDNRNYGLRNLTFSLNLAKSRNYELASSKEIEYELAEILGQASRAWLKILPLRFIFIFDELDKIEDHSYSLRRESDNNKSTNLYQEHNDIESEDLSRKRRKKIASILSSLKHFFNTANGKFFFIAGSEMYDAALADTTERESFIGSIFHDVIYVPSFYSDFDNQTSDITRLVERYLCQFLTPKKYQLEEKKKADKSGFHENCKNHDDLSFYYEYLIRKNIFNLGQIELKKTIIFLRSFIVYLTNRCNGSPKKLIKLIEDHLVIDQEPTNSHYFIAGLETKPIKNNTRYYLFFDEVNQYKIGFTSYLFTPFIYTHSSYMMNHSDKLLVTSSFLFDHFYKFHNQAFYKSSFELTPELASYSRVPELRKFMDSLFNMISKKHIWKINSGLFDYKFQFAISSEITYLSKVLQLEAAIYNFTLDESIQLKRYYRSKLDEIVEMNSEYDPQVFKHQYAKSFLYSLLADLHFYDKEYNDAVTYYENAILPLDNLSIDEYDIGTFIVYIRNMLKLGLAYEHLKNFDTSYVIYNKTSAKTIRYLLNSQKKENELGESVQHFKFYSRALMQALICRLTIIEKSGLNSVVHGDLEQVIKDFSSIYHGDVENLLLEENILLESEFYNKLANFYFFKNCSLLDVDPKHRFLNDVKSVCFGRFHDSFVKKRKQAIIAEYLKLPKNTQVVLEIKRQKITKGFSNTELLEIKNKVREHIYLTKDSKWMKGVSYFMGQLEYAHYPSFAVSLYLFMLENIVRRLDLNEYKKIKKIRDLLCALNAILLKGSQDIHNANVGENYLSKNLLVSISNYLSKLGNALLVYHNGNFALEALVRLFKKDPFKQPGWDEDPIGLVIVCFWLSSNYALRANETKIHAFKMTKILYLLRDHIDHQGNMGGELVKNREELLKNIRKYITKKILLSLNKANHSTRRAGINYYRFNTEGDCEYDKNKTYKCDANRDTKFTLNETKMFIEKFNDPITLGFLLESMPNSVETDEVKILYFDIVLKLFGLYKLYNNPISSYYVPNSQANKTLLLLHKSRLNNEIFEQLDKIRSSSEEDHTPLITHLRSLNLIENLDSSETRLDEASIRDITQKLILDSIFCHVELIKTYKVFGPSYVYSYYKVARAHEILGKWCERFKKYLGEISEKKEAIEKLEVLVNRESVPNLDPSYHYEQALENYYSSINMHTEQDTYHNNLHNMSYLEDHFEDGMNHFAAAMERWRLNSGDTYMHIFRLKHMLRPDFGTTPDINEIENFTIPNRN